jgi:hypothetical protein
MSKMLKANKDNLDKKQRKRNKDKIIKTFLTGSQKKEDHNKYLL